MQIVRSILSESLAIVLVIAAGFSTLLLPYALYWAKIDIAALLVLISVVCHGTLLRSSWIRTQWEKRNRFRVAIVQTIILALAAAIAVMLVARWLVS